MQTQSAEQTLEDISRRRPALVSVLQAFSPILQKQEELGALAAKECVATKRTLSTENHRFGQGVSLLASADLPDLSDIITRTAREFEGPLAAIPRLTGKTAALTPLFLDLAKDKQQSLFSAIIENAPEKLEALVPDDLDLLEAMLYAGFVVASTLHGLRSASFPQHDDASDRPWDTNNAWQQGYCPFCGSYPIIAWLDRGKVDERNTYLLPGGGRKHLHCGVCGANWRFLRLSCPACGTQKSKQIEILSEENDKFGESLDWCTTCKAYCPTVDIRDRIALPNMEAQALGMLHLELIAWEKELHPLRASFWNTFS